MANPNQSEVETNDEEMLATLGGLDTQIERVDTNAIALINKSEVEAQLDAAHKHPRSIKAFLNEAGTLATLNQDIAEMCIYSVPRGGKQITGPSVRMAEICASSYGNLHIGARVVDIEDKQIVAQGVAWDLQKNLRVTMEVRRSIVNKHGKRFNDDMINTTGNAAASIALRNAIFRVVPRAYVDSLFARVRKVAVGDLKTLADRRKDVIDRLQKMNVPVERIYAKLGKASIEDVGLEDVELLVGLGTSLKSGDVTIDEAFPPIVVAPAPGTAPAAEGQRMSIKPPTKSPESKPARKPAPELAILLDKYKTAESAADLVTANEMRARVDNRNGFIAEEIEQLKAAESEAEKRLRM